MPNLRPNRLNAAVTHFGKHCSGIFEANVPCDRYATKYEKNFVTNKFIQVCVHSEALASVAQSQLIYSLKTISLILCKMKIFSFFACACVFSFLFSFLCNAQTENWYSLCWPTNVGINSVKSRKPCVVLVSKFCFPLSDQLESRAFSLCTLAHSYDTSCRNIISIYPNRSFLLWRHINVYLAYCGPWHNELEAFVRTINKRLNYQFDELNETENCC